MMLWQLDIMHTAHTMIREHDTVHINEIVEYNAIIKFHYLVTIPFNIIYTHINRRFKLYVKRPNWPESESKYPNQVI